MQYFLLRHPERLMLLKLVARRRRAKQHARADIATAILLRGYLDVLQVMLEMLLVAKMATGPSPGNR